MKNLKIKNLLKVGILAFGISLFFTGCEKEQIIEPVETVNNQEEQSVHIEQVSISQIPNVEKFLKSKPIASKSVSSKGSSTKNDETAFGEVDFTKILKLTDSLGKETYTFRMVNPTISDENSNKLFFDNLVVKVDDNNIDYSAYILRYFFGEENNNPDYSYQGLSGKIEHFPLTETSFGLSFIDTSLFSKESCWIKVQTDCGLSGHHASLDDPGCSSNVLTVIITVECSETPDEQLVSDNYTTPGETGEDPSHGGGRPGSTSPIIPLYDATDQAKYDALDELLNLRSFEFSWLYREENYETAMALWDFLENDASTEAVEAANHMVDELMTSIYGNINNEMVEDFLKITIEIPTAKLDRFIELNEIIEDDPWALIQDCAEQNGMNTSNYIDLYNHTIPQECQNRLDILGPGYSNQPISEGNVPCANVDYYSVEITNYPDFDNDGNPDTEAEIYQAFREKFTDLASGEKEDFQFSCDVPLNSDNTADINWEFVPFSANDVNLFTSNNPLTAMFLIEAGASGFLTNLSADEGAIIVSDYTSNDWTISTIQTPDTETQPFSGNRQWGWLINQNGNLELFTRAVDVARISDLILKDRSNPFSDNDEECQQNDYYNVAEATWKNMQQEIAQWINDDEISNGGQASINSPKAVRVKKETIQEILTSNDSINQILSNCN